MPPTLAARTPPGMIPYCSTSPTQGSRATRWICRWCGILLGAWGGISCYAPDLQVGWDPFGGLGWDLVLRAGSAGGVGSSGSAVGSSGGGVASLAVGISCCWDLLLLGSRAVGISCCWDLVLLGSRAVGISCFALNPQGHGESEGARGLRGFFETFDDLAIDLLQLHQALHAEDPHAYHPHATLSIGLPPTAHYLPPGGA